MPLGRGCSCRHGRQSCRCRRCHGRRAVTCGASRGSHAARPARTAPADRRRPPPCPAQHCPAALSAGSSAGRARSAPRSRPSAARAPLSCPRLSLQRAASPHSAFIEAKKILSRSIVSRSISGSRGARNSESPESTPRFGPELTHARAAMLWHPPRADRIRDADGRRATAN